MSMMVAVAVWPSAPPQHSPMFGQRASSHTVLRFSFLRSLWIFVNLSPPGRVRFNQSGFLVFSCKEMQWFAGALVPYPLYLGGMAIDAWGSKDSFKDAKIVSHACQTNIKTAPNVLPSNSVHIQNMGSRQLQNLL